MGNNINKHLVGVSIYLIGLFGCLISIWFIHGCVSNNNKNHIIKIDDSIKLPDDEITIYKDIFKIQEIRDDYYSIFILNEEKEYINLYLGSARIFLDVPENEKIWVELTKKYTHYYDTGNPKTAGYRTVTYCKIHLHSLKEIVKLQCKKSFID